MSLVENIIAQLKFAEANHTWSDATAYTDFLDRVILEVRSLHFASSKTEFGKQFKPADEPVVGSEAPQLYRVGQAVRTKEGYLGYVAGHDKKGSAIVNVVFEACEYAERNLSALPDADVLEAMKQ